MCYSCLLLWVLLVSCLSKPLLTRMIHAVSLNITYSLSHLIFTSIFELYSHSCLWQCDFIFCFMQIVNRDQEQYDKQKWYIVCQGICCPQPAVPVDTSVDYWGRSGWLTLMGAAQIQRFGSQLAMLAISLTSHIRPDDAWYHLTAPDTPYIRLAHFCRWMVGSN